LAFEQSDFLLQAIPKTAELGWEASLEMGGYCILLDGIPSSRGKWKMSSSMMMGEMFFTLSKKFKFPHRDCKRKCSVFSQLWCCFSFSKQGHTF